MKKSAGILLYRRTKQGVEVFLVHPGGPFWKNKETGAWSIPKGEFEDEDPLTAALREFREETGITLSGNFSPLQPVKLKSGKLIYAFACKGDLDPGKIISNTFELEWPPRSGHKELFPEIDKGAWFTILNAREKINPSQAALLDELINLTL